MKKVFASLALLVLTTISLYAQDPDGRRGLVLNLGANNSRFSEDLDDTDCLLALFFGADFILCPSGPLRFSTGMNYSRTGSEYKFGGEGGEGGNYSVETRSALAYLNIPAEAQYEFGAGNIRPFHFQIRMAAVAALRHRAGFCFHAGKLLWLRAVADTQN